MNDEMKPKENTKKNEELVTRPGSSVNSHFHADGQHGPIEKNIPPDGPETINDDHSFTGIKEKKEVQCVHSFLPVLIRPDYDENVLHDQTLEHLDSKFEIMSLKFVKARNYLTFFKRHWLTFKRVGGFMSRMSTFTTNRLVNALDGQ
jgi:hypothetical protein